MPTFGNSDIIQDVNGNALTGVLIQVYASQSDATKAINLLGSATTNSYGQWPITINGMDQVWVRDPTGRIWVVPSDTVAGDHAARLAALESGPATSLTSLDSNTTTNINSGTSATRGALDALYGVKYAVKTANYTLVSTDKIVGFNGTALTATLPDPTTAPTTHTFTVKNLNSSTLTVVSAGTSKTIDGASSQTISQWGSGTYETDGTQWLSVGGGSTGSAGVFTPESYGALGNGKMLTDVVTTASSAVVTSASGGFAGAVAGQYIYIAKGGGFANVPLVTTISSVQSNTQVTLATTVASTLSGVGAIYGTDDTAAIQSAINAANTYGIARGGATIKFSEAIYVVAGGMVTGTISAPTVTLGTTGTTGGTFGAGTYYWKVTATNSVGETVGSNEVTATLLANGTQVLNWTAVMAATGYKVYRSTTSGGESTTPALVATIGSGSTVTYTDTGTATSAGAVPASNTATTLRAQLQLPAINPVTSPRKVNLTFQGPREATSYVHWLEPNPPTQGAVLFSMYYNDNSQTTGQPPTVVGGPVTGYGQNNGLFSNMRVIWDGVNILAAHRSCLSGLDLFGVGQAVIKSFSYFTCSQTANASGTAWPVMRQMTGANPSAWPTFAYRTPTVGNNAQNTLDRITSYNAYYGVVFADHFTAQMVGVIGSNAAVVAAANSPAHFAFIANLCSEITDIPVFCDNGGTYGFGGAQAIFIAALNSEDATTLVSDPGNALRGEIHLEQLSLNPPFGGTNGAKNVRVIYDGQNRGPVGSPPAIPTSGTALANGYFRDVNVVVSGGTVSQIAIDGVNQGVTSGPVTLPTGSSITLTYTVAPTWAWSLR